MRIVKNLAAAAVAVILVASLAGCQLAGQAFDEAVRQAQPEPATDAGAEPLRPEPSEGTLVRVLRVVDGDTIAIQPDSNFRATNDAGTEHVIRLLGIDTPEMNKMSEGPAECGAQDSLDHLEAILLNAGNDVAVIFDPLADRTDRYGRSLAYVQLPDGLNTDVALAMSLDGYAAAWYPQGEPEPTRFPAYVEAQRAAETANAGVHASCDSIGR